MSLSLLSWACTTPAPKLSPGFLILASGSACYRSWVKCIFFYLASDFVIKVELKALLLQRPKLPSLLEYQRGGEFSCCHFLSFIFQNKRRKKFEILFPVAVHWCLSIKHQAVWCAAQQKYIPHRRGALWLIFFNWFIFYDFVTMSSKYCHNTKDLSTLLYFHLIFHKVRGLFSVTLIGI